MSRDLNDINASSRSEMVCPECWERGLVAHQRRVQAYDSDKDKIIHASGCRTEGCEHHYKNGEPIPAKVIEMQLGAGRSFSPKEIVARTSLKTVGVIIGISLFGIALLIAVTGLPFLGGPGGSGGVASADTSVSKANESISEVGGGPNWTIYKYGDQYVVAGENSNGETVYLNGSGVVVDSVHFFDTEQDARKAIGQWEQIVVENPNTTIDPDARNISSPELDSPWSVFKVNSSAYVVAAENSEGNVVFLHPDGSVSVEPYFYDTQLAAEEALIEWNLDNLPSSEFKETTASEVENVLNDGTTAPISGGGGGGGGSGGGSDPIDGNESEGSYNVTEVKGSVTGPSGDALTNAKVILDSGEKETTTDQSGAYSFDSVESGTHTLSVIPTDLESTAAPRSAKFEVGDSGNIELQKAPSSAIYFTDSDGDVARNEIDWTAPEAQQIKALGNGSRINSNITFANNLNANDVTISLSSVATSSEREIQFNASSPLDFTARGNTQPRNPVLTLFGDSKASDKMLTGNSTKATHTLEGNQPIENPEVTLEGFQEVSSLKQQQAASGNSQTFTVGGNLPTINHQLQLIGDTESRSISTSKSQNSFTHDVRGNLRPQNVQFQVTGQENTNNRQVTGEIKDGELTVQVNGNQPAENVQLQLNGRSQTETVNSKTWSGGGGTCYWGRCDWLTKSKTLIPATPDGSTREYILDIEGDWQDQNYDGGQSFSISKHVEPYQEWVDPIMGGDGYYETYNTTQVDSWSTTCGYSTCDPSNTAPPIDYRKEVIINTPEYPDNPNYGKWEGSFHGQGYDHLDLTVDVIQKQKTRDVSVSGPGISGTYNDNVGGSGSSTVNIGSLSPGTHTFDIQTSGEQGVNYELTFQERSVTENVRVKADGDTRCSENTVPGSTTCTVDSSNVSPSSTLSFSSNGPTPEVSMSYTARAGVTSGSVDVGGQTFNYDHSNNEMGVLTSGDTYEMSPSAFSPGQKELTVQSQSVDGMNPTLQAVVEYKERTATKNVRLMHDGNTICQKPNALTGSTSCDIEDSTLVGGDNITIKANGLPVKYELGYGAIAKVGDATLSIDGTEFSYPEDFGKSQPLGDGEKATIELDSLTLGEHTLDMSSIETNGVKIDGEAQLSYIGDILTSYKPSVTVINPNGTTYEHPVPASQLDNERLTENVTISLPQRYFDKGGNEVIVKTADGSFVRADLEATGLQYQANRFRREEEEKAS